MTDRCGHCKQPNLSRTRVFVEEGKDFKYTMQGNKSPTSMEILKVTVPKHRYYAFRKLWTEVFVPVFYQMKISPHLHAKTRKVELQTKANTPVNNLKKCAHFLHAFLLGFDLGDANPLLFNDDLCIESSEIKKVKPVRRGHASRGLLARLSDKGGKRKSAVEISTNTRILIVGSKLHIIGLSANIRAARISLCRVILGGSPAAKANSEGRPRIARLRDLVCLACSCLWLCPEKLIKL
ncbi:hypothetical protein RJ640_001928 [Escallonia rubra]|uniref:PNO1 second type I KH domain-containing protein n=2 Tax=Escallonia rubra TaxID=112253 RepID=A0AA88UDV7_9ASTE|nr:hypothetical protein RJ640_001928 [Escallonia rubra]